MGIGANRASGQRVRILWVDDDENQLQWSALTLTRYLGVEVCGAICAEEAIRKLQTERFSLIVTDRQLPTIDGVELLKYVRDGQAGDAVRDLPFLFVSGGEPPSAVGTRLRTHTFRFVRWLSKPCSHVELARVVQEMLAEFAREG